MCHASQFFLQRHRKGVADSQVETGQSLSSTMKTKAEGVLRLGPNVRQVHTVKDQKAIRTSRPIPSAHWLCRAAGGPRCELSQVNQQALSGRKDNTFLFSEG